MNESISYGKQNVSEDDIQEVVKVLRSDWLTQGPAIERFEKQVAAYCGARYAVAVSSATAGLHIACLAAELKPGDLLWTSANTFAASANCGRYCGSDVDFVDIDPLTANLSLADLTKKLDQASAQDRLPKILVPVHFAGQSCDMRAIAELAKKYKITVIEDASHALGGTYQGHRIGGGQYSDMTILSFHPVKMITTGEGGMVLTNQKDLYDRLVRLRTHGITRDPNQLRFPSSGAWYYEQIELGFNYRLTDIQAALGISQLKRLDDFVRCRAEISDYYREKLASLPLKMLDRTPQANSSNHLFVVRLVLNRISKTHAQVFDELRALGIGVNLHYIPVYLHPYYRQLGFGPGHCVESEKYAAEALSLPIHTNLTAEDLHRVYRALQKVLQ